MRRLKWVIGLLLTIVLVTSCATTVQVRHLVPAEVSLNGRREIAIASATAPASVRRPNLWIEGLQDTGFSLYSGWDGEIPAKVSRQTTDAITAELSNTGYFSLLSPRETDGHMAQICSGKDGCSLLKERGISALMVLDIPYIEAAEQVVGRDVHTLVTKEIEVANPLYDPTIPKDEQVEPATIKVSHTFNEVTGREYFLIQRATLTLTYTLYDTTDGRVIASRTFTDSREQETKIGTRTYGADLKTYRDERSYFSSVAPSFEALCRAITSSMATKISSQLAPSWESSQVTLMEVKPKGELSKEANKAVRRGEYQQAYELYMQLWRQHSFAAGYNAAILLEGMGKLDEALALMSDVYHQSGSSRSYAALIRIQEVKSQHDKAQRQISGEQFEDGQSLTLTQYMISE